MHHLSNFVADRRAATAIEYGLIAPLIAVAGIPAFSKIGGGVRNTFNNASAKL